MFLNFIKIAPDSFADDGMSYQERMRREAAKLERKSKLAKLAEHILVGAIRWTFAAAVFVLVGGFVFLVIGGLIHGASE